MRTVPLSGLLSVFAASLAFAGLLAAGSATAKLPPLSDDAKAKAAEAAAKTAWSNKVADYQLCKSMDKAAAKYFTAIKAAGKDAKPATETPPCVDPGPFAAAAPAASSPASGGATAMPAAAGSAPAGTPAVAPAASGAAKKS